MKKLALALIAALSLTACNPYGQGPAGTVVGKDRTYWAATKQWTYKLTVRTPDGTESTFKVLSGAYYHCYRGSSYPKCTER